MRVGYITYFGTCRNLGEDFEKLSATHGREVGSRCRLIMLKRQEQESSPQGTTQNEAERLGRKGGGT